MSFTDEYLELKKKREKEKKEREERKKKKEEAEAAAAAKAFEEEYFALKEKRLAKKEDIAPSVSNLPTVASKEIMENIAPYNDAVARSSAIILANADKGAAIKRIEDAESPRRANIWDLTKNSAKRGYYNSKLGEESYYAMNGQANEKEVYQKILAGDEYNFETGNWLEKAVSGAFELGGQIFKQSTDPTTVALATGAGGAAAIAGQIGPQVLLPEEIVTVPTAFFAGLASGNAAAAMKIEGGHAYNELIEAGVSHDLAQKVAVGIGAVNGSLEALQVDELLDAYRATVGKGASKTLIKRIADELLDRGIDVAKETGQEVLQEGVTIGGVQLASKAETGEWAYSGDEVKDRLKDTTVSSLLSFGMLNVPAASKNIYTISRDQATTSKLTDNEQKVVDKVVDDEIAKREQNGTKLSSKEKFAIKKDVIEQMDKGYISTDAIGEVLGGDNYNAYKESVDSATALENQRKALQYEYDELGSKENPTLADQTKYAEIGQQLKDLQAKIDDPNTKAQSNSLKAKLDKIVFDLVKNDRLRESFLEPVRAQQEFQADYSKFEKAKHQDAVKQTIDNAIKAGANNTNKVHDIVDYAAKLAGDTGKAFDFQHADQIKANFIERQSELIAKLESLANRNDVQNEKLAQMKELLEKVKSGETEVNGSVSANGIVLNLDSKNPLNRIVGHEVTHILEPAKGKQSKEYTTLRDALYKYAKVKKIDVNQKLAEYKLMYEGLEANAEAELVADMVGDFLFNDTDFINQLTVENRNLAQKIYDEIKYLLKLATAGSQEARELERVKKAFEDAYRNNAENSSNTKYSLENGNKRKYNKRSRYSETETLFLSWENGSAPVGEVKKFSRFGKTRYYEKTESGSVELSKQQFIERNNVYAENTYRRAERRFGTTADYDETTQRGLSGDHIGYRDTSGNAAVFGQTIREKLQHDTAGSESSTLRDGIGNSNITEYNDEASGEPGASFVTFGNDYATIRNFMKEGDTGEKYSLSDSTGRQLSTEQQDYFKDSIVRDENGNLKVMYHGTSKGGHTVFDTYGSNYGLFGTGSYFTDSKNIAESYTKKGKGSNPQVYESYLNIKNPIDMDAQADPAKWAEAFEDVDFPESGTNEQFYRTVEEFYSDQYMPKWEVAEIIQETLQHGMGYDGITHIGGGRVNANSERHQVYIAFDPEQIKNTDNMNPTGDPDIRYSLSEKKNEQVNAYQYNLDNGDLDLAEMNVEEYANLAMPDSKIRDESGRLIPVYHGTKEMFWEFDTSVNGAKNGTAEGFGIYLSDDQEVTQAYGDRQIKMFANITNPATSFDKTISQKTLVKLIKDTCEKEAQKMVADGEYDSVREAIKDTWISNYVYTYDMSMEQAYREVAQLFLKQNTSDMDIVQEVMFGMAIRNYDQAMDFYRNSLTPITGIDGFITKWENSGKTSNIYLAFDSSQLKSADAVTKDDNGNIIPLSERFNPGKTDIRRSLSNTSERLTPIRENEFFGKDFGVQKEIAPAQTTTETENVAPVAESAADTDLFPEVTPVQTELDNLQQQRAKLEQAMTEAIRAEDIDTFTKVNAEYDSVMDRIEELENEISETENDRINSLTDEDVPPEMEAPYPGKPNSVPDPFAERDMFDVGKRNVKAYMYENPEVKPFFQEAANIMLGDLHSGTKGEKIYNEQLHYDSGGEKGWMGTKRNTTADIADLLDTWHYTYDQIEKGLNAIIEDNGAENNAVSKRIEFMLHDRLVNGYTGVWGEPMPANQAYINFLQEREVNEYSSEAFNSFMETADQYVPEDIAPAKAPAPVKTVTEKAPVKETYEAIKPQEEPKMVRVDNAKAEQTANVLVGEQNTTKKKQGLWSLIKEYVLDNGMVFEDLSKKTKNRNIEAKWNFIRYARGMAQHLMENGTNGVKSLKSTMDEVNSTGKTQQFYEYLYHMHNVDRMTLETRYQGAINKAVFGDSVTADMSRVAATELAKENPEFRAWARDIYRYNENLRQILVDGGVISQETANLWAEMYPHYVPIRRAGDFGLSVNVPLDSKRTGVNAPVKKAKGGSQDILDLFDTMGQRTIQTLTAVAKNRFGVELKNALSSVVDSNKVGIDEVIDSIDTHEELLQEGKNGKSPTFTVFENGEKVTFEITEEMYEAMKPAGKGLSFTFKPTNIASSLHRGVLTEYNPVFMITNALKDAQDVLINSQHALKTYAKFPKAVQELSQKGAWYNEYMANGGEQNSYFDSETNTFVEENKALEAIKKWTGLGAISNANNFIERIPRLAEYIASREAGRSIEESMLDAARVTTNFAAGGKLTKALNRNGFTFLNASVQGAVQQVRNVREAKMNGLRGVATLAAKFVAVGLGAALLNHVLWDDDEEYEELSDYVKDNYYIVAKYGDGQFVRIPKGRMVAVIQSGFQQMENLITGNDEVDLKRFGELLVSNLAPNNPLDNNILAPVSQVMSNTTWYGDDLVPTRLQDLPAAEQYDETTDSISKWLGEKLDVSPYKINYLLEQYTGGIGDTVLPMLTPAAERGDNSFAGNLLAPLKDKFTTDSVLKNQNVSDFYETKDELTTNAKASKATDEDVLRSKYMNSVNADLSELYAQKREIQNSNLPDSVKYDRVRDIQQQIVDLSKIGLSNYEKISYESDPRTGDEYAKIGDRYFKNNNGEWTKLSDDQLTKYKATKAAGDAYYATDGTNHYRWNVPGEDSDSEPGWYKITDEQLEKQNKVTKGLGISPEDYWGNKAEYDYAYEHPENYAVAKAVGGYDSYKAYSSELYDIKADKDSNGKSISGSRKEKVIDYINNLDADYGEKIILFKSEYPADDTYNSDILDYLNSRKDLSYDERVTILKKLGFTVTSDGRVRW